MDVNHIIEMLSVEGEQKEELFARAVRVRDSGIGQGIYLRGLIEYSNVCRKNCFYCGIRSDKTDVGRYTLSSAEVLDAARFAYENDYGSIVLQGGEIITKEHISAITGIIRDIKEMSGGRLGITLSLGEQSHDTYEKWFDAGAHRYLLRIETSNPELYKKIHPADGFHKYETRLKVLYDLREAGYQVGTGIMVGLPYQTVEDLAADLLFMKKFDIDMCGMGPYVLSNGTPLAESAAGIIKPDRWRLDMTLKMTAVLRILMPDINIAAATAVQAIDPDGRMKAIGAGSNVIMPNITPESAQKRYMLYENKPFLRNLDNIPEKHIKYGEWGDSPRFLGRKGQS